MPCDDLEIAPAPGALAAAVQPPGSKSLTNRALLLAAMADGTSVISAALSSDDTLQMAAALRRLGFSVEWQPESCTITIEGRGGRIPVSHGELDIGGAGTAMRFIAGFLTLGRGRFRIDGNPRMRRRPIGGLLQAMARLGIDARSEHGNGCPPVLINTLSSGFSGGRATIDASLSSQFVSALLMPAALWPDGLVLTVQGETARPFIKMTTCLMKAWGVESHCEGATITVPGGQGYRPMHFMVEPDATAASYFAAAAVLVGGSVIIHGLGPDSLQGDIGFFDILQRMGGRITWRGDGVEVSGSGKFNGVDVELNTMPDVVATLAAIAPFAASPTRIRKIGFIRHHESDRIHALAVELARLGAAVSELDDGLEIRPAALHPASIATYDDHRIAMAFAIAGLKLPGLRIQNPDCVAKTYPAFFEHLARLS